MSLNHNKEYGVAMKRLLRMVHEHAAHLASKPLVERACPVCGSAEYVFHANNGYFDYAKCAVCALVFQNPTVTQTEVESWYTGGDAVLAEFSKIAMQFRTAIPDRPDPATDNKLRDIYALKKEGRLLDVGCSVGEFLHSAKYFYDVEGVEVDPVPAAVAAKSFTVHEGFLHELRLAPAYDIVTLHQILFGLADPVGLLRDIHRVLNSDGILYINTPNADSYAMELFKGKANHYTGFATQNIFNRRSLDRLADETGFTVTRFRTEWIDIYIADLLVWLDTPSEFIHKRNAGVDNYEERIKMEDALHRQLGFDLKDRGNYCVAILEKK